MGLDWKDLASWGLGGMPKQLFESSAFKKGNRMIGKAFPNEISEYANKTQNIPILGWLMSGLSATDMASTAYDDTGSVSKAWEGGTAGTFGKSRDPGAYSATGERADWDSNDAFQGMVGNQVGGIGNFAGRIFGGEGKSGNGWVGPAQSITGMIDNAIQPEAGKTGYVPENVNISLPENTNDPYYDPYYYPESGVTSQNTNQGVSLNNSGAIDSILGIIMNLLSNKQ